VTQQRSNKEQDLDHLYSVSRFRWALQHRAFGLLCRKQVNKFDQKLQRRGPEFVSIEKIQLILLFVHPFRLLWLCIYHPPQSRTFVQDEGSKSNSGFAYPGVHEKAPFSGCNKSWFDCLKAELSTVITKWITQSD
jgi:hypothetical protein